MLTLCHPAGCSWLHHACFAMWHVFWNAALCCAVQLLWNTEANVIFEQLASSWRLSRHFSLNGWKVHMWNMYHCCRNICNSSWMSRSDCHQDAPAMHTHRSNSSLILHHQQVPDPTANALLYCICLMLITPAERQPMFIHASSFLLHCHGMRFTVHASCSQLIDPSSKSASQTLCAFAMG